MEFELIVVKIEIQVAVTAVVFTPIKFKALISQITVPVKRFKIEKVLPEIIL